VWVDIAGEAAFAVAVAVVFAFALLGPHKAVAVEPAERPARVKHMDVRVFRQDKDVLSKNPAGGTDPDRVSGRGAQAGVCFLLVTFLCTSKEK